MDEFSRTGRRSGRRRSDNRKNDWSPGGGGSRKRSGRAGRTSARSFSSTRTSSRSPPTSPRTSRKVRRRSRPRKRRRSRSRSPSYPSPPLLPRSRSRSRDSRRRRSPPTPPRGSLSPPHPPRRRSSSSDHHHHQDYSAYIDKRDRRGSQRRSRRYQDDSPASDNDSTTSNNEGHRRRKRTSRRRRESSRQSKKNRRKRRRRRSSSTPPSFSSSQSRSRSPSPRPEPQARRTITGVVSDDEAAAAANYGAGAGTISSKQGGTSAPPSNRTNLREPTTTSKKAAPARTKTASSPPLPANKKARKQQNQRRPGVAGAAARSDTSKLRGRDDTVGHFDGGKGTIIADRYKILRQVGLGTFGRVVECLDLKRNQPSGRQQDHRDAKPFVALKIVRKIKRYYESALIEARIVDSINRRGGRGRTHCVVMYDAFSFDGHYCMVFESLGPSLFDFLKRHDYQPFPMVCVQDFAVQLLQTMEFLHAARLIHTDLKIENVLLMNDREVNYGNQRVPESTRLKLIDFGGACYDSDKKSSVINTRQYRAPEVILGTGWSMPSDMWSVGCMLMELYQGELLFATHDNVEHLALMERIIGPFPRRMIQVAKTSGTQSDVARQAFDSSDCHRMERVLEPENAAYVRQCSRLEYLSRAPEDSWFFDLLRKILVIDPTERATAHECLQFLSRIRRNEVRYG